MTVSNLASRSILTSNHYAGRAYNITRVTIHEMAAVWSAERCGLFFRDGTQNASSNYGIGNDGDIICYVEEQNAAWTSANWDNDNRAITIEVSNSFMGGDWPISGAAYESLVALCADICKRYGIMPEYNGTPYASFTEHKMFYPTACPGPYIHELLESGELINDIKAAMFPKPKPEPDKEELKMTLNEIKYAILGFKGAWKDFDGKVHSNKADINQLINEAARPWSYKNPNLETKDTYQILRDIRDGVERIEDKLEDAIKKLD